MSVQILRRLLGNQDGPAIERGRVVSVEAQNVVVRLRKRTRKVQNATSFSLAPGDYVSLQGSQIIAKRKPPPSSATYEV